MCGWGLCGLFDGDRSVEDGSAARWLDALLDGGRKKVWAPARAESLAAWLSQRMGQPVVDPLSDLVAAAWWWHWPETAKSLTADQRADLIDRYIEHVERWLAEPIDWAPIDWASLLWQLEIPLLIAWNLSAESGKPPWLKDVMLLLEQRLAQIPEEPAGWCDRGASQLRVRWASLLRSQWLAMQIEGRRCGKAARAGLVLLADWALAWSAADGRPLLSPCNSLSGDVEGAPHEIGVGEMGAAVPCAAGWHSRLDRGLWRLQWELVGASGAQAELSASRLPRSWRPSSKQIGEPRSVARLDDPPVLFDSQSASWVSGCLARRGSGRIACDWSQSDLRLEIGRAHV